MVQVVLRSMDNLDSIQKGLAGYFENNELSLRRKEARKRSLLALQSDLETKLLSLDSLKTLVNSSVVPRSTGQGIILGEPIDPVKVYIAQIKYYKEKLDIDEQLANPNSIETLQPLLRLTESNYPSYNHLLLYSFGVALLLGVLFTPVIGKRK
jgi:hypothetical protein